MNFLFAWRYFRAKKSTNAINVIAWVSMTAIVVGSTALILVLSVFNGFEDLVKSLYQSFYPDLKISPASGKNITLTEAQLQKLKSISGVRALSLVAEDKALLEHGDWKAIAYLKGVDENFAQVTGVKGKLTRGNFDLGTEERPMAILGSGVENALAVEADRAVFPLSVYLFRRGGAADMAGDPMASVSNANVGTSGVFMIQQDFDDHYAITNLAFIKKMLAMRADEYGAAEIALTDPDPAAAINLKSTISAVLGPNYQVQTRFEQNQSLYTVMRTEKWVIYILLTLILVVAAFNMVGALTMLVWEKQKDIHVLKALGASNGMIQRIFLSEGLLLAVLGGGLGILLAVVICWLQVHFKLIPMQGGTFLIDYYPVKLVATDFVLVLCTILVVALLASWIPSRRAALTPIELR